MKKKTHTHTHNKFKAKKKYKTIKLMMNKKVVIVRFLKKASMMMLHFEDLIAKIDFFVFVLFSVRSFIFLFVVKDKYPALE